MSLKGRPLPEGGTIGVPSPSWPYHNRSEILRGVEWWERKGYRVKLAENVFTRRGYVAGDPKERANGIVEMFADPEVDVVQVADAGFGAAHTLPFIDFDVIKDHPKPFIGYSDTTALHSAIHSKTDLVTFYGPLLCSLGQADPQEFTDEAMLRALTGNSALGPAPRKPNDDYLRAFNSGVIEAPLVGGCLWLLTHLIGTPWQPDFTGKILFFEDVSAPPWHIDVQLTQMAQAGMLDGIVGVVIGEMHDVNWAHEGRHEWPQVISIEDVFEEHIEPLGVPTLYGFPMGHGKYLWSVPLGVKVRLDADERTLEFVESALE
jgi:muramoyltetrapeptide carboxypeptidase